VPEGAPGHLWFAHVDGPCFVKNLAAGNLMVVRPGNSVHVRSGGEASLVTPAEDRITMRGPAALVLESVTRHARSGKPRYRLREVAGELQIDFHNGHEVEVVLDQRAVETSAGTLRISRTSNNAQELELVSGDATMIDPLGRMVLNLNQKLLYDE
jgi:hypothetical protein